MIARTAAIAALVLLALPGSADAATGLIRVDADRATEIDSARVAAALGVASTDLVPLSTPFPTGGVFTSGASLEPCAGQSSTPLGLVVDAASSQLRDLRSDEAQATLSSAIEGLPCATEVIDRDTLITTLELLGQAAQDEGDEAAARAAYGQLLAVAPGFSLTSAPGTGYETLFDDVRRTALSSATADVWVQHAEWTVAIDGAPVRTDRGATVRAMPGRHLLQWEVAGALVGVWMTVEEGGVVVIAIEPADVLLEGPVDTGRRLAIEGWLTDKATTADLDGVAVVQTADPLAGYVVRGGAAEAWVAPAEDASAGGPGGSGPAASGVGLRLAVGGGWMLASLASYGDIAAALDVGLVGPLHLRVDFDLGVSQPISLPGSELDGKTALLPGVGVGVALRRPGGPVQPFGALTVGLWITPGSTNEQALADALEIGADVEALEARGPVTFRGWVDGGVDLHPGDSPLLIRLYGGIGYGFGFQARAGAQVGFRVGG